MAKNVKTKEKGTTEKNELEDIELMQKSVSFYETLLAAWLNSRMEKDKQILTLSSVAIGLLVAFRSGINDIPSLCIVLFAGALFVSSMIVVLDIFKRNSDYLMLVIQNNNEEQMMSEEKSLQRRTAWAFRLFIAGVVLTIFLVAYRVVLLIYKGA